MDNELIGQRIKKFRDRQGLSQEQVASYLGMSSRSQISLIENGKKPIDLEKLEKLANLFGVNLGVFVSENEKKFTTELAFAFRTDEVNESDLEEIADFKKIVLNHQKMKRLANG